MKRRFVALAAALALSAGGATLVAGQASADDGTAAATASAARTSLPPFASKTYLITVDNGNVYKNTYSADGTSLHSETVAAPASARPSTPPWPPPRSAGASTSPTGSSPTASPSATS
ncbi:hypothetical protein ACFQ1I_23235 [Kitasatospora arboriphila]